jgi:hypothetical protein
MDIQTIVGADLGFYSTKVTDGQQTVVFESCVGYGAESMIGQQDNDMIFFQDGTAVGQAAIRYAKTLRRHTDDSWLTSPEITRLFQAGLSRILESQPSLQKAFCVCALPISLYKFSKGDLAGHLSRVHHFIMAEGSEFQVESQIREIPQAFACLCNEFLSHDGRPVSKLALERVGVVDIGGRDLNLLIADGFRTVDSRSETFQLGCWGLIESVRMRLADRFGRPSLSEYEAERALRSGHLAHCGEEVSVLDIIEEEREKYLASIKTTIASLWGDEVNRLSKIYVTGGGSILIGEALLDSYRQGSLVPDPVVANAIGAYKYARFLMNQEVK